MGKQGLGTNEKKRLENLKKKPEGKSVEVELKRGALEE